MCTRFVYHGTHTMVGFTFDIDLSVWNHKVILEKDRFFIGIRMPDEQYHSFHGVNRNGHAGTLLYVNGNENGRSQEDKTCMTISDLTENYIRGILSFDDALQTVQTKKIIYAEDATMQSMLSDRDGRVLIIEPGIGYRLEHTRYSLITNYSLLDPVSTRPFLVPGDDRFERAKTLLDHQGAFLSVEEAFCILKSVRQEGLWATRVSFVYDVEKNKVCYVLNNDFEHVLEHSFF